MSQFYPPALGRAVPNSCAVRGACRRASTRHALPVPAIVAAQSRCASSVLASQSIGLHSATEYHHRDQNHSHHSISTTRGGNKAAKSRRQRRRRRRARCAKRARAKRRRVRACRKPHMAQEHKARVQAHYDSHVKNLSTEEVRGGRKTGLLYSERKKQCLLLPRVIRAAKNSIHFSATHPSRRPSNSGGRARQHRSSRSTMRSSGG